MKARDIIAGWPRGRSTSVFTPLSVRDYLADLVLAKAYAMYWSPRPAALRLMEAIENDLYHRGQQRMMDMWHERWRNGFNEQIGHRLVQDGEIGRCYGFECEDMT